MLGTTLAAQHAPAFQGGLAATMALLTLFALWAHYDAKKHRAAATAPEVCHLEMAETGSDSSSLAAAKSA